MRALAPHVPADRITSQCRANRSHTFGSGPRHGSSWLLTSAVPTTTPHQHVVDAGVECITEEWLIPAETQPLRSQKQLCHVSTAKQETPANPSTKYSSEQVLPQTSIPNSTSGAAASITTQAQAQQEDRQQLGLHILRRYVPSPAELLHSQLQKPQTALQQSTSPELVVADAEKEYQKAIMCSLTTCSSVHELSDILQQHGSSLDFMSITSCFTTAAQLATQQDQPQYAAQQQTASSIWHIPTQQQHCDQQNCNSQHQHGPAKLQHPEHQQLADAWRSNDAWGQQHVQQLKGTAASRNTMSRDQLHELVQRQLVPLLRAKLQRSADATGLVLVLYSLAMMAYKTDGRLLLDLEHGVTPWIPQLTARLLSQLLWSLAVLEMQPHQQLMLGLLLQSGRRMQEANAQDCAQMIYSFARLKHTPPSQWMDMFYGQVLQLLQTGNMVPQSLSMIMYSLGKLQLHPPAPLLLLLQAQSEQALPQLPPVGLVMLGQALHMLHIKQPSSSWQYSYLQAVQAVLPMCTARETAVLVLPLLRWRCVPPEQWVEQYLQACEPHLSHMTPQGLAVLGHSLSGLKVLPPKQWLMAFLSAARKQQLASTPAGCSYLIHTLGAWSALTAPGTAAELQLQRTAVQVPSRTAQATPAERAQLEALVAACVNCFMDEGSHFTAKQLGMFCKSLAMMRLQGTQRLSKKLQQVLLSLLKPQSRRSRSPQQQQQQQQLTAATLVSILLALAVNCSAAATAKVLSALWPSLQQKLHTVAPAQAAAIVWSLAKLGAAAQTAELNSNSTSIRPPTELVQGLLQQAAIEVESASLGDLTVLLLRVRQAGWVVKPGRVQFLIGELLKKQAKLLQQQQSSTGFDMTPSALESMGPGLLQQQQRRQQYSTSCAAGFDAESQGFPGRGGCCCGSAAGMMGANSSRAAPAHGGRCGSSNSLSYRVFGVESLLGATSAAAVWAPVLGPRTRYAALQLLQGALEHFGFILLGPYSSGDCNSMSSAGCAADIGRTDGDDDESCSQLLMSLAADVLMLACPAEGFASGQGAEDSSRRRQLPRQQQQQQWVQLPQGLALLLWRQREAFWSTLSRRQQRVLSMYWEHHGLVDRCARQLRSPLIAGKAD